MCQLSQSIKVQSSLMKLLYAEGVVATRLQGGRAVNVRCVKESSFFDLQSVKCSGNANVFSFSVLLGIRIWYRFAYSFVHGSNNTGKKTRNDRPDLPDTVRRHVD